jgi:hypothetical protein
MQLTRRHVALAGAAAVATASLLLGSAAVAQSGDEAAVNAAIEALRKGDDGRGQDSTGRACC